MRAKRVLIFGGTSEARELANRLVAEGFDVVTAMAGVTLEPSLPAGEVHRGGLGGVEGIAAYATENGFDVIVDATHPFAAKISANIALAAQRLALPCLRLERDAWRVSAGDQWTEVADFDQAAAALPVGARVLLTIGQRGVAPFFDRGDLGGVVRVIEAPSFDMPLTWLLVQARPPYSREDELRLIDQYRITAIVSKNAGGSATIAKLIAARERKIPVVMISRPFKPAMSSFTKVEALVEALKA